MTLTWPSLAPGDDGYPALLGSIYDPPRRLFVRGRRVELLRGPCVALVGARSCSGYGASVARMLGRDLARSGAVVVSGLARGIDGEAHRGALEVEGATIAVLGCGIDRDYPAVNAGLARRIEESGLIVSEYPPGTEPSPWRFPARNRIVAGLSRVTIVVEARERSGALITADFALEEGREVLAVPGEITAAVSVGTNHLIRMGAAPLLTAADALAALGLDAPPAQKHASGPAATVVLGVLRDGPASIDELTQRSGLGTDVVSAALVELELDGLASEEKGVYRAHD
jgi:DNA processing protein